MRPTWLPYEPKISSWRVFDDDFAPYTCQGASKVKGISSDMAFWDDFGDQMGRKMKPRLDLGKAAEVICAIVDFERPYNVFSWFWLVQEFKMIFL